MLVFKPDQSAETGISLSTTEATKDMVSA